MHTVTFQPVDHAGRPAGQMSCIHSGNPNITTHISMDLGPDELDTVMYEETGTVDPETGKKRKKRKKCKHILDMAKIKDDNPNFKKGKLETDLSLIKDVGNG